MTNNIKNPLVSVAILTWNRRHEVARAIESVLRQSYQPIEIVVVDSASTDGTADFIAEQFPSVKLFRLPRNLGCPDGRNIAFANCSGEVIFSLDDDGWLADDTIEQCLSRFAASPRLGVLACSILAPDSARDPSQPDRVTREFSGGASAIRRQVLGHTGYYPTDFFRQAEEFDLSLRVIDSGYDIVRTNDAVMYHKPSPTNRHTNLFMYFSCRNQLYSVIRRYPWPLVPFGFLQKAWSWNSMAARRLALHFTLAATLVVLWRLPRLLMDRKAISLSSMRRYLVIAKVERLAGKPR